MKKKNSPSDSRIIDNIRMLSVDCVQKANSGHPGLPLGFAAVMYALYKNHLNIYPTKPDWMNRDRLVLSAGHGSALLYVMNHLAGYDISMDDLKNFRQVNSCTAGHPEYDIKHGIETTTGPLGQGIANAVGFAIAERYLNNLFKYHSDGSLINHYTYCIVGDGCLQEGISHEALSLAGRLKLNKLILLFDSNSVQLDTMTSACISDDIKKRMEAYHWNYILVEDPYCIDNVNAAILKAKKSKKPTFIEFKTIIGKDTLVANTPKAHGAPLSPEAYKDLQDKLNIHEPFKVLPETKKEFDHIFKEEKKLIYAKYYENFYNSVNHWPDPILLFHRFENQEKQWNIEEIYNQIKTTKPTATRNLMSAIFEQLKGDPFYLAGSADLSGSTKVNAHTKQFDYDDYSGQEIKYGVREFAMGAICNGIVLHSNLVSFTGTFLSFADYMKPAIRLAALMEIPSIFCFSHDSIFLGEDGPTHQPIEQLSMLRNIPNLYVFRPCNDAELIFAFDYSYTQRKNPKAIILTRQNVAYPNSSDLQKVAHGGYVIKSETLSLQLTIVATGSEVPNAIDVANKIENELQLGVRVVSIPCYELFFEQPLSYQKEIIDENKPLVNIEASSPLGRKEYFNNTKLVIGVDTFGMSGKYTDLVNQFHFDIKSIYNKIVKELKLKK